MEQDAPYAAWESILVAEKLTPLDIKLHQTKSEISASAHSFAVKLKEADVAEKKGEYSIAMTRYLQARHYFPGSQTSRMGIERSARALLKTM